MENIDKKTPSQEIKDILNGFYVLNRDNMWGKKDEIVKHIKDFGSSNQNSSWMASDGGIIPYVACDLEYCISQGYVTSLYDYLRLNDKIKITDLASYLK